MSDPANEKRCPAAESILGQYSAGSEIFGEMEEAPGAPRPHWRGFMDSLQRLGRQELASRWENGRRLIREHGVTYNVYGDPQGMDRPWALDLIPLLISAEDWSRIEAGLVQRSRLFNLILADIYSGGQRLLRDGFLPPELVYANPGFLRPCRGIVPAKNVFLHLHACDLARSADGKWWVLGDRTQAPSGVGYALENRSVISRVLPDEIRHQNVRHLAGFFRAESEMLFKLAPGGSDNPNIVLLTPGPHNETYFEHAYLARHLGFPLVEGADLTVRQQRVFLKTLEGLQPVDVILRRVDDSFCDPLELRGESFLGVAGLVEATRAGNVTLTNALGTGLMESPAMLAFLPGLCRHLLGEELLLPSAATWWCGQGKELRYVLEQLDKLVVKPAFGAPTRQPWFGGGLSRAERTQLAAMMRARPRDFVGQERVTLSRAPVWAENRFESRPILLRSYVANGGDSIAVLPGGLTRVSRTAEDPLVSMQSGGGSKDTWVLGAGIASRTAGNALAPAPSRSSHRSISGTPSRAADNLFWLGRYTERLEQTLRILRCVVARLSDEAMEESAAEFTALGSLVTNLHLFPASAGPTVHELQQQVLQLIYKPNVTGSVRELLGRVRFIASVVRDRFSGDMWRILGRLDADGRSRPGRLPLASATALIHTLVFDLAAFNGVAQENMTRGHGWRFLDVGRRLERAQSAVRLARAAACIEGPTRQMLETVLEIADSAMTYRRRHFAAPRLAEVLELLLCDESNPRALAFQIGELRLHAAALPPPSAAIALSREQPPGTPATVVQTAHLETLVKRKPAPPGASLIQWLDALGAGLTSLSEEITGRYFNHTVPRVS